MSHTWAAVREGKGERGKEGERERKKIHQTYMGSSEGGNEKMEERGREKERVQE